MYRAGRQLARRQGRLVERELDDAVAHRLRNAVPHPLRARYPVRQGIGPTLAIPVVPAIEGRPRDAELCQRVAHRQRRAFDQPDDFQLLGGRVSHASSSPGFTHQTALIAEPARQPRTSVWKWALMSAPM